MALTERVSGAFPKARRDHGRSHFARGAVRITESKRDSVRATVAGRLHVGLGDAATIDRLVVRWPDGAREVHLALAADRHYLLKRGEKPSELRASGTGR